MVVAERHQYKSDMAEALAVHSHTDAHRLVDPQTVEARNTEVERVGVAGLCIELVWFRVSVALQPEIDASYDHN